MEQFYKEVNTSQSANIVNGIGSQFDIGIIKNGKFEWISIT